MKTSMSASLRYVLAGTMLNVLAAACLSASAQDTSLPDLSNQVVALRAQQAALTSRIDAQNAIISRLLRGQKLLEERLRCISAKGTDVYFTGCNVHIRNGDPAARTDTVNGLGNLIVGYDEDELTFPFGHSSSVKTGSHNIVVGAGHTYSSYSGLIAGMMNHATGAEATVSGGFGNTASGLDTSVSGGSFNTASGDFSSVSGGLGNDATADDATVAGGHTNTASGEDASVAGGGWNIASGEAASVSGGQFNIAAGAQSTVGGGVEHTASGDSNWVAGGTYFAPD